MNTEQLDKIKEAISLLSKERVNTSGLGAPINILKALVEDSEQQINYFLQRSIVKIIDNNYNEYSGTNEAVLHASEEIVDLINSIFKPIKSEQQPEDKQSAIVPSAAIYLLDIAKKINNPIYNWGIGYTAELMESYSQLKVQHMVKDNEENKQFALQLSSIIATSKSIEEAMQRYKEAYLKRFGDGRQ